MIPEGVTESPDVGIKATGSDPQTGERPRVSELSWLPVCSVFESTTTEVTPCLSGLWKRQKKPACSVHCVRKGCPSRRQTKEYYDRLSRR